MNTTNSNRSGKKDKLEAARRACYADVENTDIGEDQGEYSRPKDDLGELELDIDIYHALVDYAHNNSIPLCEYLSYENINRFLELII